MDLNQLLAERAIYRQLVKFARAMDNRDWDALATITTPDIEADLGLGVETGRDALVNTMRQFLDKCGATQHLLGNVLIDVDGDSATSEAYVADLHLGTGDNAELTFRTLGIYHDQWQKREGRWLMCKRRKDNRDTIGSMAVFNG